MGQLLQRKLLSMLFFGSIWLQLEDQVLYICFMSLSLLTYHDSLAGMIIIDRYRVLSLTSTQWHMAAIVFSSLKAGKR